MLRRFDIHKTISLGFFNGREQNEQIIEPGLGHLEFDGHDIYWVTGDRRLMSDTINEAILIWLRSGDIVERD
ncbi:hypothetical protein ACTJKJ_14795 [Roseateles sp. 22389]|uniref:hypothetical protein n=1 Tax=Roseateles sp. 22389 TaxID=3453916 RepID=UPI003F86F3BC